MTGSAPVPERVLRVFTDTHAHLSYIARRQGPEALATMLQAYAEACRTGTPAGAGTGDEANAPISDSAGAGSPVIVDPGVDPDDFPGRAERFGHIGFIRLAAGIWPSREAFDNPEASLSRLATHAADPRCRAIGECGPDYHHMNGTREAQKRLFSGQLELAKECRKPVIVHSRDAAADTADTIAAARMSVPVIIHCFGYGPEEAERFLSLGCMISFAGNITYKSAGALREACLLVPSDRLLLETDAPYMNPLPSRGKPSTSLDIERTYRFIAGLRGIDPAGLATTVTENARALFGG